MGETKIILKTSPPSKALYLEDFSFFEIPPGAFENTDTLYTLEQTLNYGKEEQTCG